LQAKSAELFGLSVTVFVQIRPTVRSECLAVRPDSQPAGATAWFGCPS
jgi:hypothetical protein